MNYSEYDETIRNRKNPNERKFLLFWPTTMKTFDAVYDESFVVEQFSARNCLWLHDRAGPFAVCKFRSVQQWASNTIDPRSFATIKHRCFALRVSLSGPLGRALKTDTRGDGLSRHVLAANYRRYPAGVITITRSASDDSVAGQPRACAIVGAQRSRSPSHRLRVETNTSFVAWLIEPDI